MREAEWSFPGDRPCFGNGGAARNAGPGGAARPAVRGRSLAFGTGPVDLAGFFS